MKGRKKFCLYATRFIRKVNGPKNSQRRCYYQYRRKIKQINVRSSGLLAWYHTYIIIILLYSPYRTLASSIFLLQTSLSTSPSFQLSHLWLISIWGLIWGFATMSFFTGWGQPHAQPPTWRTRVSFLVWFFTWDLSGLGGPASSYAMAGIALKVNRTQKPHCHDITHCKDYPENTKSMSMI